MPTNVRSELFDSAQAALRNPRGPFIEAVRSFAADLRAIPDAEPSEYSHEELGRICDLAECILLEIEDRLEDANTSPRAKQELARTVEAMRRTLEAIHQREQHFLRIDSRQAEAP